MFLIASKRLCYQSLMRIANNSIPRLNINNSVHDKFQLMLPKGTHDFNPKTMKKLEKILALICNAFKRHDAVAIETPVFELREILKAKFSDEENLVYDLEDQGGKFLSLRYDLTVPFARYLAMNKIKNIKRYQIGKVYRRDKPQINRGRYREFYQCDFDVAGEYGLMMADVECLRIIYEVLFEINLGEFFIKLNHRRFMDGILAACGVPSDKFTTVSSSIDKLDKLAWSDIRRELIEVKCISPQSVDLIKEYVHISGGIEVLNLLEADERLMMIPSIRETLPEMRLLMKYCDTVGVAHAIRLDLSLARGLNYYTGIIYEAILSSFAHIPSNATEDGYCDGLGVHNQLNSESITVGSVAGGGRYDNLVSQYLPSIKVPCVGLSFGVERLLSIATALEKTYSSDALNVRPTETKVMVVAAHRGLIIPRLEICRQLWDANIKTAFSHKNNPNLLDQLQYCEGNQIPLAVVIGGTELKRGAVRLRDVINRKDREINICLLVQEIKLELEDRALHYD